MSVLSKLRTLPPSTVLRFLERRRVDRLHRFRRPSKARRARGLDLGGLSKALQPGCTVESLVVNRLARFPGFVIDDETESQVLDFIASEHPDWRDECIARAERVLEHRFRILGIDILTGPRIDWHRDYLSGHRWPSRPFWNLTRISLEDDSDIKLPWELSRFHHGLLLGKAYRHTGDERYAREFAVQFTDWIEQNPPYTGVNWACTMEVAIRIINLVWSFYFLRGSSTISNRHRIRFAMAVLVHARFIMDNLEYQERLVGSRLQPVNGNHYFSNLVALVQLGVLFPEFRESKAWREFAIPAFQRELLLQVDEDGVHFENSPAYHRLVLEMTASTMRVLQSAGHDVPEAVTRRIRGMTRFVQAYLRPDGDAPNIRDGDSGRFLVLGNEELTSHRHAQALGALAAGAPELLPESMYEDSLWQFGTAPIRLAGCSPKARAVVPLVSSAWPISGFYILRHGSLHLVATASPVGMHGHCGHTHGDFLSFELHAAGVPILVDSGTFVYSRFPKWRNRFRSTRAHNTIQVEAHEILPFPEDKLFSIQVAARPIVEFWNSDDEADRLQASYDSRLGPGTYFRHVRRFHLDKVRGFVVVEDFLFGNTAPTTSTRFHLAPSLHGEFGLDSLQVVPKNGPPVLRIKDISEKPLVPCFESGWHSSTYARREPTAVAVYTSQSPLPAVRTYLLVPGDIPAGSDAFESMAAAWATARSRYPTPSPRQ